MKFRKSMIIAAGLTASLAFGTVASADTVTVKSGDTLWGLSKQYNVSVDKIKSANGLSTNNIYVGQSINIPTATVTNRTHTVGSGDTLWSISRQYNTTVQTIKNLNNLSSNAIYVGQKISISGQASSGSTGGSTTTATSYTVKSGDSLWSISRQHNVTVNQIKQWNGLSSNVIRIGQTLKLQASQSSTPEPAKTSLVDDIIADAKQHIGTPYVWGGSTPAGFDCSGFLNYVFAQNGISIPRTVASIYDAGSSITSPRVGDLVFFETYKPGASHAGLYLGNNQFIHASSSNGITISSMDNSYWKQRYLGAKKYF
ncbi:LysM repeat protein [Salirhabdus euzebyi]|uniref:LysM repeat protein n=1 Tax=Salirhabdus euzebyi TaxID=394506 RepID=A0A841Q6A3_9BACI|nr:C40 family peptidase [Salirhabdus euzebyi]MBB6453883.1 LysM repeat protein [Salirhabdus euzebyi]